MRSAHVSVLFLAASLPASGALFGVGVSSNSPPWPGGIVPYAFDAAVTAPQQAVYLDGLREWELAANIQFIPRTAETQYLLLRFDPFASDNTVTGAAPQVMTLNVLTRGQIAHEMGHSLGLEHEHVRSDRDTYINVLTNNIIPPAQGLYVIPANHTDFGDYDYNSVMHFSRNLFSIDPANLNAMEAKPPFAFQTPKLGNLALSRGDRAAAAHLYGPGPALSHVVTHTGDGGPGSLRAAMYHAIDSPGTPITFNIPTNDPGFVHGTYTIAQSGTLPLLAEAAIELDATTQPGYTNHPVVQLDGSALIPEAGVFPGLTVYSEDNRVRGLAIGGFPDLGVLLIYPEAVSNHLEACFIGTDALGQTANPNGFHGVGLFEGASDNVIGATNSTDRNVISGNTRYGVLMVDSNTTGNVVLGNYIGTDASGSSALANGLSGVGIFEQASGNRVGPDNLLSGNTEYGMLITEPGTTGNRVEGNWIGLDASGGMALSNRLSGVGLFGDASGNVVGGTNAAARNVISGNAQYGVLIAGAGTSNQVVEGNYIGTDVAGTNGVPNLFSGVGVFGQTQANRIGGAGPGAGNLLSGNAGYGLLIAEPGTRDHRVEGNRVGTDAGGSASVPNQFGGILVNDGVKNLEVADNVIAGNSGSGLIFIGIGTSDHRVTGNLIGLKPDGVSPLPNNGDGVIFFDNASNIVVGLDALGGGEANRIAHNAFAGVFLFNDVGGGITIRGNAITSNGFLGVDLDQGGFGPAPNDPGDADIGPNDLQNYPVITNLVTWGNATVIQGVLTSRASRVYHIDLYRNAAADGSGFGEGEVFAGTTTVTTDGGGLAPFSTGIEGAFTSQVFSAIATDVATGDSSEFSPSPSAVPGTTGPSAAAWTTIAISNGAPVLTGLVEPGWPYSVEYTTNTADWVTLTNWIPAAVTIGMENLLDPFAPYRAFRLSSP